jgi:HPt (histidine-containing phosphotransfer) domain-containing protein
VSEPLLLDDAVLDDLVEHVGEEATRAIIELFLAECRELTETIAGGDVMPARRAAHSLKSSAGQLGAAALAEAALAVEIAGPTELPDCLAVLSDCAARTEVALVARLAAC